jgi:hypothetical protein
MALIIRAAAVTLCAWVLAGGALADPAAAVDAAYARRAEGSEGERAAPAAARAAVTAAAGAAAAAPEDVALRWRELRALHFLGEFATRGDAAQREVFARAMARSDEALAQLAARAGGEALDAIAPGERRARLAAARVDPSDAGELYFWSAVAVGAWSQKTGLLDAVRAGVTNRLERYTRAALDLAPGAYDGGPHRLWARMHTTLPRVPLLTSWVDRKLALPAAERAVRVAPEHPGNQVLLAMTLQDLHPARAAEARSLLERIAALTPRAGYAVEDEAVKALARKRLAGLRAE